MFDIETFDFELFKEYANFEKAQCGLIFRSRKEQILFEEYLISHCIPFSGYGLNEYDLNHVAVMWSVVSQAVYGYSLDGIKPHLVNLEYFCEKNFPFISSEKDLFDFLNQ